MGRHFQTYDKRGVTVPEGKWVAEFFVEHCTVPGDWPEEPSPSMPGTQVIGITRDEQEQICTHKHGYRTGANGWMQMNTILVVADKPFATIWTSGAGSDYVFATVVPGRQIHKGELGQYPPIENFPEVRRRAGKRAGKMHAWVKWSDVADKYGEPDLQKLWRQFLPFSDRGGDTDGMPVHYEDTGAEGVVYYPHPIRVPRKLEHWSGLFDNGSFNASRARQPERYHARIQEFEDRRREEFTQHVADVQARRCIPDMLWDDPLLQLEHLSVPVNFAKSVLYCKQFGYNPDFTELMAAIARYQARRNR